MVDISGISRGIQSKCTCLCCPSAQRPRTVLKTDDDSTVGKGRLCECRCGCGEGGQNKVQGLRLISKRDEALVLIDNFSLD